MGFIGQPRGFSLCRQVPASATGGDGTAPDLFQHIRPIARESTGGHKPGKRCRDLRPRLKTVCEAIVPVASKALIFSARWHSAHLANRLTPVLKQGSSLHP